jgi:hypothetical protein
VSNSWMVWRATKALGLSPRELLLPGHKGVQLVTSPPFSRATAVERTKQ